MPEHVFQILEVNISSMNYNIAWIKGSSEETVKEIFRNSAIYQMGKLNMFPIIPSCGLDRKKAIENLFYKCPRKWRDVL